MAANLAIQNAPVETPGNFGGTGTVAASKRFRIRSATVPATTHATLDAYASVTSNASQAAPRLAARTAAVSGTPRGRDAGSAKRGASNANECPYHDRGQQQGYPATAAEVEDSAMKAKVPGTKATVTSFHDS